MVCEIVGIGASVLCCNRLRANSILFTKTIGAFYEKSLK